MNAVWTLAGLTIKEAVRRRIFIAALLVALIFVLFAFLPLHIGANSAGAQQEEAQAGFAKLLAWLGCGVIKFFGSILAVTLAAGSITAEVERGVLSVVAPKPLPRLAIYLGKWLGLIGLLAASVALWAVLLAGGIYIQTHHFFPRIFVGVLATFLFPLLFATLTLCFSSFAPYALSAGLSLIAAGVALAQGTLEALSVWLSAPVLHTMSIATGYIVPLDKMNHWITRGLGSAGFDMSAAMAMRRGGDASATAVTQGDMVYILLYIAAALAVGIIVFQKRDL